MSFDPFQPAVTLAESETCRVHEQAGECWLYEMSTGFATKLPERPGDWWDNDAIIQWATRKAIKAMPV